MLSIEKSRYLMELKALLSFMDADEKAETVAVYRELFEAIEPDGTEQLIEELGSPVRLVLRLEKSYRAGQLSDVLQNVRDITEQKTAEKEAVEQELPPEEEASSEPEEEVPYGEEYVEPETETQELEFVEADIEEAIPEELPPEAEEPVEIQEAEDSASELPAEEEMPAETNEEPEEVPAEENAPDLAESEEDGESRINEITVSDAEEIVEAPASKEKIHKVPYSAKKQVPKEDEEPEEKRPSGGRIALAILCTPFLLIFAALGIAATLLLCALPGAFCALMAICARYFCMYAIVSMTYMPDVLMVLGLGVVLAGLMLAGLNLTLRLLFGGIRLLYVLLSNAYGKLLGKEKKNDE